jgi:hypothetical protein
MLSANELKKYTKIISNDSILDAFKDMMKFIHKDNEDEETVSEEL